MWNLDDASWQFSSDLPPRPDETLSLPVTLANEQHIEIPEEL